MKATLRKAGAVTRRVTNLRMYGEIIGRRMGLTIKSGNISTGCTDGKTVFINFAAFSDDPDAVVLLDGTCTHEFGHVRYTDFLAKTPILKRPLALSFYRSLEDGRMEACEKRDYPGMALRIEAALGIMVKKGLFAMPLEDESVEDLFPNMLLGWVRSQYLGQGILEPMYRARMAMLCTMVGMPVVKGFLDIARDGIERARKTQDIVDCSVALEEYLRRELQSMQSQQAEAGGGDSSEEESGERDESGSKGQGESADKKEGQGGEQDADDKSQGGAGAAGDDQDGQNDPSGDSSDGKEAGSDSQSDSDSRSGSQGQEETDGKNSDETGTSQQDGKGGEQVDDQTDNGTSQGNGRSSGSAGEEGSAGSPAGDQTSDEVGDGKGTQPTAAGEPDGDLDQAIQALSQLLGAQDLPDTDLGNLLQEAIDQTAPQSQVTEIRQKRAIPDGEALQPYAAMTRQIELKVVSQLELLLESRLEERSHLERSGRKLSSRHLACIKSTPYPRVFRIDEDVSGVSTAVSVLLDVSGSMDLALEDGFSRLHAAVASARAAVAAMDKHEVPCSMHFFGEYLTEVKGFEEPWRRVRDLHWIDTERNTLTGHAVERIAPALAMRDEERKLLLLVTDGFPAEPDRSAAALQTCASFGVETAIMLINSGGAGSSSHLESFTRLLDSFGLSWIEVNSTTQLADGLIQAIRDAV